MILWNRKADVLLLLLLSLTALAASAQRLQSPWDRAAIVPTDAPYRCPDPPQFDNVSHSEPYYTDAHASIVDPVRKAAYDKATQSLTQLGQSAGLAADAWLATGSRAAATCVYELLAAAANADAWAAEQPSFQDVYNQNWMLSGTAIPYLKVRNSGLAAPGQQAAIEAWFSRVAARVRTYFDHGKGHPGSDAHNNHFYWAGLAVAAQGIACNQRAAFLWGISTYYQGVHLIQPDGSLAAEMNRASRALHYQLYALGPLVILAELGEANGIDMYAMNQGALHRLVRFNIDALEDPGIIAKRTGVAQEVSAPWSGLEIGWAVPWLKRFPDPRLAPFVAKAPWVRFWQWGGAPPEPLLPRPAPTGRQAAFEAALRRAFDARIAAEFTDPARSAAFVGQWCGNALQTRRASITDAGPYLILANENGDTSTGRVVEEGLIVAPGWQSVVGLLTPNGVQIDWSNGTYWLRCAATQPTPQPFAQAASLSGKWFPEGPLNKPCTIRQQQDNLTIRCPHGSKATGRVESGSRLSAIWSAGTIGATVTADGNHINWDNQTWWTRSVLYDPSGK
jgi:poly(beta-D-mannuronate) lyase